MTGVCITTVVRQELSVYIIKALRTLLEDSDNVDMALPIYDRSDPEDWQ